MWLNQVAPTGSSLRMKDTYLLTAKNNTFQDKRIVQLGYKWHYRTQYDAAVLHIYSVWATISMSKSVSDSDKWPNGSFRRHSLAPSNLQSRFIELSLLCIALFFFYVCKTALHDSWLQPYCSCHINVSLSVTLTDAKSKDNLATEFLYSLLHINYMDGEYWCAYL